MGFKEGQQIWCCNRNLVNEYIGEVHENEWNNLEYFVRERCDDKKE